MSKLFAEIKFTVYILECNDLTYYTGSTNNMTRRLKEHQDGHGARYTKGRRPVKLIYTESYDTLGEARRRERRIKKMTRQQKAELGEVPK